MESRGSGFGCTVARYMLAAIERNATSLGFVALGMLTIKARRPSQALESIFAA
jgi:hypothetical protein